MPGRKLWLLIDLPQCGDRAITKRGLDCKEGMSNALIGSRALAYSPHNSQAVRNPSEVRAKGRRRHDREVYFGADVILVFTQHALQHRSARLAELGIMALCIAQRVSATPPCKLRSSAHQKFASVLPADG